MTDEYQIKGTVIAEEDGSGDLVIKNIDSVSTEDATVNDALTVNGELSVLEIISLTDSGSFIDFESQMIPDTGRTPVTDQAANKAGVLAAHATSNNRPAIFLFQEGSDPTIVSQTAALFSTTEGNDGTVNVYHDSGTHYIENQVGFGQSFAWVWIALSS